jgi:hypothetical protein
VALVGTLGQCWAWRKVEAMASNRSHARNLQDVHTLFGIGAVGGLSDEQLLDRFLERRDEVAEAAFAALVARHGPMVLRACRALLRDPHDAQDALQATFFILARRAGSIRSRDSVASWLHGVACRVSARAKAGEDSSCVPRAFLGQ